MGFVRNFNAITLRGGNLHVEGINATEDDVSEKDIKELLIMVISVPGHDKVVTGAADVDELEPGNWTVLIKDVPPPFDKAGDVIAVGMATVYDEDHHGTYQVLWGGNTEIRRP
jgi:hypothetical protein